VTLTWPAATDESGEISYRVLRGEEVVAEPAAADAMQHVVDGLAEFSEYSFSVQAVDLAGNASEPLTLTVRTADNTPPTWAEGCELAATVVDEDDLDKGLQLAWCEATDNDRMERFSIRRYGTEIASAPPQQLEHTHLERPLDGSYSVAACDPSGNCSPLERVPMYPERDERMAEVHELVMSKSLLALLESSSSMDNMFGSDVLFGDLESGVGGVISASAFDDVVGVGGLGSRGSGLGGGGTGEGLGGLGTRGYGGGGGVAVGYGGSSSYKAPSVSSDGGKPAELAAHVDRRLSRIERCYTTALSDSAGLSGTMNVQLRADAEGLVTVDGVSGAGDGSLHTCVTNALRGRLSTEPGDDLSGSFKVTLDPGSR